MSEQLPELEHRFAVEIAHRRHGDNCTASDLANRLMPFLKEVERAAAAREMAEIRRAIRSIPHWWNTEDQRGGFDLQPLGPDASSEEGAFMEVMRVLDARAAEIREGKSDDD